jgi:hypothetical protein
MSFKLEARVWPQYSLFMAAKPTHPEELREFPPPTPAPPDLAARATELVERYPECFWFWHPEARVRHLEDVRLVVEHLREYGDHRAWWDAQELHRCLSPLFKKKY